MANSRFAYVREFEERDNIIPQTYIIIRIDGVGFHAFSELHGFAKPNDQKALELMNKAAEQVVLMMPDVQLGFGESDEYSFLLKKEAKAFSRRRSKLTSHVVSMFTAAYVFYWKKYINRPLLKPPVFDARAVVYPNISIVMDYFKWRQADTHVNNLYNTAYWCLRKQDMSGKQATEKLKGTYAKDKQEILWQAGINYNNELDIFKKGSIVKRCKGEVQIVHVDLIGDGFWTDLNLEGEVVGGGIQAETGVQ